MQHIHLYSDQAANFEADVHLLIRNTLHASLAQLSREADAQVTEIKKALGKTNLEEVREHLIDSHVDVLATGISQERFLTNMAVVALASRLLHTLKKMARLAEHFCPSTHNYNGKSEFMRLWAEYKSRFSIDFKAHADRIAFVEPMVRVRNQIVHEGAEANTWNDTTIECLRQGQVPKLDVGFSQAYPGFVTGEGWDAEVVVSQEQFDEMCNDSIALVRWLATELDAQDRQASS